MSVAFIGVGANVEPEKNIHAALILLQKRTRVTGSSTFYRTKPMGGRNQPPYVNGVWQIETELSPVEVKTRLLRSIEQQLGRVRTGDKYSARPIDLDLILYDDLVTQASDLRLPHPDIARPFVYFPVLELLTEMRRDSLGDVAARMQRLLPAKTPTAEIGELLEDLTRELRGLLHG